MVKRSHKKNIGVTKNATTSKFVWSIKSSIVFWIILIVVAVSAFVYAYSITLVNNIQKQLPNDFVQSLYVFDNNNQTSEQFEAELPLLQGKLNQIISKNYTVKDIVVTDEKFTEKFSSLNKEEDAFRYIIENKASSFKLVKCGRYNVNNYRALFVQKDFSETVDGKVSQKTYHIHLIIPNGDDTQMKELNNIAKYFFAAMLLISLFIALVVAKGIVAPLLDMKEIVAKIAKGDLSGRLDYTKYKEINELVQSYNMMANALQRLYSTLEIQVQDRTKELKAAYAELQSTQAMMVHSEKMKSLGELVAGIMHEINNPINFIYGNMTHLSNYSNDLIQVIEEYTKYAESLKPEERECVRNLLNEIDYEFLKTDLPDLIKSCKEGADRAKNIIQDLKSFSRMEEAAISDVDIPHEIDTTLNILHNKIKNKAEIHKEYMENVPKIEAFGGQLNQVFMNILDNAVGAIKETGDVWIRINPDSSYKNIIVEIEDNGAGMNAETVNKVFNPFFTTKPVGQGTGLGLSITYKIIKNHQGDIKCVSELGKGTKFIITLPINIDRENLNAGVALGGEDGQV